MWWRRLRYVLLLAALCAIATCPAAKRACTHNTRAREAEDTLDYLGDRVARAVALTGKVPPTPAGPSPQPGCCDQGGACAPDEATWSAEGWRELGFTLDDPYRFTYAYVPDPSGRSATIRAVGDLACDGQASSYEVKLTVIGRLVSRTWTRNDPTE